MNLISRTLILIVVLSACSKTQKTESDQVSRQSETKKSFEYIPQEPVNGKNMGVIEIGSLGLNYFIIEIDSTDRWSLVKSEFGRSNFVFGDQNKEPLIAKIKAFKDDILSSGVARNNLHIVASSSAMDNSKFNWLKDEINNLELTLTSVDAEQEARFALMAAVPAEFVRESFLVDMGSGNTKLSWTNGKDTTTIETFGSKYYVDEVQDSTAFRKVRDALLQIPEANRNLCFMLGGMPFEFASESGPKNGRYTILNPPSALANNSERKNAGIILYNALFLEPTYSYIFDWDSNFSVGYLMSIN